MVSSKPRPGRGNGGGVAAATPAACSDVSDAATGVTDSASGIMMGGGVGMIPLGAEGRVRSNASNGVSGGGTGAAAVAGAAWIASRRWRSSATWFMAFRAKTRATIAITSAKKTKGSSNIWPPGGRVEAVTGHVRSLVAILCAALSAKSSNGPAPSAHHSSPDRSVSDRGSAAHHAGSVACCAASGERCVIPDRAGTAGLRPSCCRDPFRRGRAASGPRAPAPCRRG